MTKEEKVIKYYVLCNKLKNTIRKGWTSWNVKRDRVESIAEHIYGVQMLAISMYTTYKYDLDIYKVIFMLAIHEIGETITGDINPFEKTREEKERLEHEAVHEILKDFDTDDNFIENTFLEFDSHSTKEAMFAYMCDKLECDLQAKIYGEEGCVDIESQKDNDIFKDELVNKLICEYGSWEKMWLKYGQEKYPYDDNFRSVSNYAIEHDIKGENENEE